MQKTTVSMQKKYECKNYFQCNAVIWLQKKKKKTYIIVKKNQFSI